MMVISLQLARRDFRSATFHFDNAVKYGKKDAISRGLMERDSREEWNSCRCCDDVFQSAPRCRGSSRLDDGKGGDLSYNQDGYGYNKEHENQER